MKYIKSIFKWLGALLLLCVLSIFAMYFTLDISKLTPSVERLLAHNTGAAVQVEGLSWSSVDALSFDQLKLTWPLSPEEEEAWELYRAAKKAKRKDESVEVPERPSPALSVCATDVTATVNLSSLIQGKSASVFMKKR